ncbi:MAG: hypothetical protein NUV56_01340 [Candidatus Uhrbacteria bacterium]|nr:hypothetical protein [Candidatus Uhrbacteria bacterium]
MAHSYEVTVYEAVVIRDAEANFAAVRLADGEYTLAEVENPTGAPVPWLVLFGTRRGAAKSWWFDQHRDELLELRDINDT